MGESYTYNSLHINLTTPGAVLRSKVAERSLSRPMGRGGNNVPAGRRKKLTGKKGRKGFHKKEAKKKVGPPKLTCPGKLHKKNGKKKRKIAPSRLHPKMYRRGTYPTKENRNGQLYTP